MKSLVYLRRNPKDISAFLHLLEDTMTYLTYIEPTHQMAILQGQFMFIACPTRMESQKIAAKRRVAMVIKRGLMYKLLHTKRNTN